MKKKIRVSEEIHDWLLISETYGTEFNRFDSWNSARTTDQVVILKCFDQLPTTSHFCHFSLGKKSLKSDQGEGGTWRMVNVVWTMEGKRWIQSCLGSHKGLAWASLSFSSSLSNGTREGGKVWNFPWFMCFCTYCLVGEPHCKIWRILKDGCVLVHVFVWWSTHLVC